MSKPMSDSKIIVISYPEDVKNELAILEQLFQEGLTCFHLRKPKFSTSKMRKYLDQIPEMYRDRVVIHSHHELAVDYKLRGIHLTRAHRQKSWRLWFKLTLIKFRRRDLSMSTSFHRLKYLHLRRIASRYDYLFLAPVFKSISKRGHESGFSDNQLKVAMEATPFKVFALGGVNKETAVHAMELGFYGVALLGAIWKSEDPVAEFKQIKSAVGELKLDVKKITHHT
jgi:thiamine-phosphate pyrophosphorylase